MTKMVVFGLSLLLVPFAASAAELYVAVERPAGICHVNLGVDRDGPVRFPVDNKQVEAIQLATRSVDDRIVVTVSAVRNELEIDPIGQFELELGGAPIVLPELERYGLRDWQLSLGIQDDDPFSRFLDGPCPIGGCCCGSLTCYPNKGQCVTCGECGMCCQSEDE